MSTDPYHDLAEILQGALSLVDYYVRRMPDTPNSIEHAKAAMQQAISDLHARVEPPTAG